MNDDTLLFANMSGGFSSIRRCALRRSCLCVSRMSAGEDGVSSLDKLRSMQQSIMRRRRGVAREISTSSEPLELEPSTSETGTQTSTPPASKHEALKSIEQKNPPRKRGRPPKDKVQGKSHSAAAVPRFLNQVASRGGSRSEDAMVPLDKQSENQAPFLSARESANGGNIFNFDDILSGQARKRTITGTPGGVDCFLEKRDGTLPILHRKKGKEVATADPVLSRIPPLSEFIAPVPFNKSPWFLPRANCLPPIEFTTSNVEVTADEECPRELENILEALNPQQRAAVTLDDKKACLVLAGPGSGKTRVLTHRAAYLVRRHKLPPHRILAVTFTNKAADEMKNRLCTLLAQEPGDGSWSSFTNNDFVVGTFHSICARLLRTHGACIGIDPNFQICDASDARQVVQFIMKNASSSAQSDSVANKAAIITTMISKLKNNGEKEMEKRMPPHFFREVTQYRALYDRKLRDMNQLDFDDLLLETRRMLDESPEVLEELNNRYLHVLVDEWQDTNSVQFDIVTALAKKHGNLFVVGDADQSIYKFRGADIRNVTRFSETFPSAQTVALEENYRSTGCIVSAAQSVIEGNRDRPNKPMRTSNAFGSQVMVCKANDGRAEASYIVSRIRELMKTKKIKSLSEVAVLYRMNAQSRLVEEAFINASMQYRLIAGTRFYDRQEVKDVISYVRLLVNPMDDMALLRAINTPPRGIGKKTVEVLQEISAAQDVSILQALENLCKVDVSESAEDEDITTLRKGALKKLAEFLFIIEKLRAQFGSTVLMASKSAEKGKATAADVIEMVIELTDYKTYLEKRSLSAGTKEINKFEERWRNIEELEAAASRYSTLTEFMESVSLLSKPADSEAEEDPASERRQPQAVSLMTMHAGKGLEFTAVFITGVEDGLLPMMRRGSEDDEAENIAEERRLAYVAMTRAKQYLTLSWRARSLVFATVKGPYWRDSKPSRFLQVIPGSLVKQAEYPAPRIGGRLSRRLSEEVQNVRTATQWHVGDSVRCAKHGRGTIVTKGEQSTALEGAAVEILFSDGKRHFVDPTLSSLELLYSPASAK